MTSPSTATVAQKSTIGKSIWAVVAGFLVIIALSLGTDEILHLLRVYPPWKEPMWDPKLNALALSYRLLFDTFGSYITAKLAPRAPLKHAVIGGFIGLVLSLGGVAAAMKVETGPLWYPIALALSSPITAWIGGMRFVRNSAGDGFSLIVCEVDLRVGGRWRFVLQGPDGKTMGMGGVYVALTPPDGSIHTEAFDDFPGEARVTTVLTEKDGKTTLVATSLAPSKEIRDAVIASGMEHGAAETYDRLAELLSQQLAAAR